MILYGRQTITESDIKATVEVLKSDYLTTGPFVAQFEEKLCALTGARYAVACTNGTAALHLACLALGIKSGDIGVTSAITFLASANCIEYCGGRADFIDIDEKTLCISMDALEDYCRIKAPKVVIPVDFAGVPANLPEIKQLAATYGFKIIEDAAHAIGSSYIWQGQEFQSGSCAHTDLATFSFHPVKSITTGEGGAVLCNDESLYYKLRSLRSHGMEKNEQCDDAPWYYEMSNPGFNYRITDFQCGMGISQLKKLPEFKERRQCIVKLYNDAFRSINEIITPPWPEVVSPCFHLYPIQIVKGSDKRKEVYNQLLAQNIRTQVHYIPVYWQPYYAMRYHYSRGKCPVSERYYSRCLSLPLYAGMTDSEVNYVIKSVMKCIMG